MKRMLLLMAVMLAAAAVSFAQEGPKAIELTEAERQFVTKNNNFALNLFRQTRSDESLILSPLSITYALGMLNNGAKGQTQQEINTVLGSNSADAINQFCRKMLTESTGLDEETRVSIANNIYLNSSRGYELKADFVAKALQYYDATPEVRNFKDGQTRDVINQWGSDHTEGMIKEVLKPDEFDPDMVSYLLNALYFKGAWVNKFDTKNTINAYFNGQKSTAMLMRQNSEFLYTENKTYQSIVMPYGNGAYQMTVYLPHYGKTIDDVLTTLDGQSLNTAKYETYNVYVLFPRFETETNQRLEDVMKALGMPTAFTEECAFEEMVNGCLHISFMKQSAKIKVDEEGSEAAAVTVIGAKDYAAPVAGYAEFIADRPFIYTISEQSTGAVFFIGQYMGEPLKNVRKDISLSDEEKKLVTQNNNFALNLMRKARSNESTVLSPLSITYALGMLNNGAAGQTQKEINAVLMGMTEESATRQKETQEADEQPTAEAINQFCRKMLSEAPGLDTETKAMISNAIFLNKDYQLQSDFVAKAEQYYDATLDTRDFHDGETMDVINQWGSDHTEGLIKEILNKETFDPDMVSYLLNAIYFKGTWKEKFDVKNTREEPFNGGDNVPMMHQTESFAYAENDTWQAVTLPYGNEAYAMTVLLPQKGKSIDDVLAELNGNNWRTYYHREVDLKLPRFETTTDQGLVDIMKALGMTTAFNREMAEFPYFCNIPTYIGMMRQSAKIKLDEEGTEAAAITIIGVAGNAAPEYTEFHADRPFLYIISEYSTGTIFFIGQYMGRLTALVDTPIHHAGQQYDAIYNLAGQRLTTTPSKGLYIRNGRLNVQK